ncbi:hypothetical protein BGZ73_008888 [Actinomortierella ambigua]|nr:hypothetical protein BGZ73_008888 [Actinomortierella ambigua]
MIMLPYEVHEFIVQQLFYGHHLHTLHALLVVNKALFDITARRLYYNPEWTCSIAKNSSATCLRLIDLLFALAPLEDKSVEQYRASRLAATGSHASDLVTAATGQRFDKPFVDYLALVRDPRLDVRRIFHLVHNHDLDRFCAGMGDTTATHDLGVRQTIASQASLHVQLEASLAWILYRSRLGAIKTMFVVDQELARYMACVQELQLLDTLVIYRANSHGDLGETAQELQSFIRMAIRFVERFQSVHGRSLLQNVELVHHSLWDLWDTDGTEPLLLLYRKLYALLPPLATSRLDQTTWLRFLLDRSRVNLGDLTHIGHPPHLHTNDSQMAAWPITQGEFFRQCRRLQHLQCRVIHRDCFEWAARERMLVKQEEQEALGSNGDHSLVNIAHLTMYCNTDFTAEVINDALLGFGHSLRKVLVTHNPGQDSPDIVIRPDWGLPVLQELRLICPRVGIELDPNALTRCPSLRVLQLVGPRTFTGLTPPPIQDLRPWHHPQLFELDLQGAVAVAFSPESFKSMANLKNLTLRGPHHTTEGYYIPQPDRTPYTELQTQQAATQEDYYLPMAKDRLWVWDWSLPHLDTLVLHGAPAFWFDFKMLAFAPSLRFLELHTARLGRRWELGDVEVLMDRANHPCGGHPLEELRLLGLWVVPDRTLERFLTRVCPNRLRRLIMRGAKGFDPVQKVRLTSQHPTLLDIMGTARLTTEEAHEAGLVTVDRDDVNFFADQDFGADRHVGPGGEKYRHSKLWSFHLDLFRRCEES